MPTIPGIRRAFRIGRRDEVAEEFAFHLALRTEELIARGFPPAAARDEATRQFGDLADAHSYCRREDSRRERRTMRGEFFEQTWSDMGFAVRTLRRTPLVTIVAAITLALGIGANTAIFSVVNAVLLRPLPFPEPERLMQVRSLYGGDPSTSSPPNFYDLRAGARSFSGLAALNRTSFNLTRSGSEPERLTGVEVSADFFNVMRIRPAIGRALGEEDERYGGPRVAVISDALWRSHFSANPSVVGQSIVLDGEPVTIVGILPKAPQYPTKSDVWVPLRFNPAYLERMRGAVWLSLIGRLAPGASLDAARTELRTIAARLEQQYPKNNTKFSADARPLRDAIVGDVRTPLFVLLGAVAFVTLIACANVATLLVVRAAAREPEIAVRTALGAARSRIARQLITESVVLSLFGGAGAIAVAWFGTRGLLLLAPADVPRLDAVHVDAAALAFTLTVALVTGTVFGLIPAIQASRPDINAVLKASGRSGRTRASTARARSALVVTEVALAVMLLAGAGLLIRSFQQLLAVDPGFKPQNVVAVNVQMPDKQYAAEEKEIQFTDAVVERLRQIPGVTGAAASTGLPLTGYSFSLTFDVDGRPEAKPGEEIASSIRLATPEYFRTMGIPVLRGQGFTGTERLGEAPAMVISESMAKQYFPGEDPIGKTIRMGWRRDSVHVGATVIDSMRLAGRIVGIVGDVRESDLSDKPEPMTYVNYQQWPDLGISFIVRTSREPKGIGAAMAAAVHAVDPNLPVTKIRTLRQIVDESVARPRFYMTLLVAFAALALVLAAVGIYGVVAYLVAQRTHELGVRLALGAPRTAVVGMVVRQGIMLAGSGVVLGLLGAISLAGLLRSLLYGVGARDPITFVGVGVALFGIAVLASWLPARRAAGVSPLVAIRGD